MYRITEKKFKKRALIDRFCQYCGKRIRYIRLEEGSGMPRDPSHWVWYRRPHICKALGEKIK